MSKRPSRRDDHGRTAARGAVSAAAERLTAGSAGEVLVCGMLAAALSCVVVLAVPRGGDLAAHLYRTQLVRHGLVVWDNLWFAGQYPLSSYSLLYYPLAALVGNAALGITGVVLAAVLFASILHREWNVVARWPARAFAILVTGQAFTAAYPYDLGLATMLAAVWALQRGRIWIAALFIILTLGFSPLAFVFLALALVALFLRRRRLNRRVLVLGGALALAAGTQLAALLLLPSPGMVYPYGTWRFVVGLAMAGVGVVLALKGRGGWSLASLFLVWAAATVAAYLVPSPVGHNLVRASVFVVPLMLVTAALASFRPRWLAVAAIAAALAATVVPYLTMIPVRSSTASSHRWYWQPVLSFLRSHLSSGFRVEVVPTANHWESYYFPQAGYALARGWYRQLDVADDPALYARTLSAADYLAWLRRSAVQYVVLPHAQLEAIDAQRESRLLTSGRSGLREVEQQANATIYEVPHPTPLLTGPGPAAVTVLNGSTIAGRVGRAGTYLLRVHFTPYWSIRRGALCLTPSSSALTRLTARRAGPFTIHALETPASVISAAFDHDARTCSAGG